MIEEDEGDEEAAGGVESILPLPLAALPAPGPPRRPRSGRALRYRRHHLAVLSAIVD